MLELYHLCHPVITPFMCVSRISPLLPMVVVLKSMALERTARHASVSDMFQGQTLFRCVPF